MDKKVIIEEIIDRDNIQNTETLNKYKNELKIN